MQNRKRKQLMGVAAVVAASVCFGMEYTMANVVSEEGMSETCNGLWVGLMTILCGLIYCAVRRQNPFRRMTLKQAGLCVAAGVCAAWLCNMMFLFAYHYLSVSETTMLHFLYPTLTTVFMTVAFRERFTLAKGLAIVCSIAGMALVTGGLTALPAMGIAIAVMSGVFYAVYPILVQTTSLKDVDSTTVVLFMYIISSISSAVISLITGKFSLPVSGTVVLCDVGLAVTSFVGYALTCWGVSVIGAVKAGFSSMLEPVVSCVFAALIVGEVLKVNVIIGAVFIVASILFVSLPAREKPAAKAE